MIKLVIGGLLLVALIFVRQQLRRFIERRIVETGDSSHSMDEIIRRRASIGR